MIDLVSLDGELGAKGGRGAGAEGRNVDHLCLRVEPYDERTILDFLAANGIAVAGRAASNFGAEGDGPSVYIADPDGNLIELKGPARPATG